MQYYYFESNVANDRFHKRVYLKFSKFQRRLHPEQHGIVHRVYEVPNAPFLMNYSPRLNYAFHSYQSVPETVDQD